MTSAARESSQLRTDEIYCLEINVDNICQDPPTGGEGGSSQHNMEVFDPSFYKTASKRTSDKNRDRRKIYQCRECSFYSHRHGNLIRHMKVRVMMLMTSFDDNNFLPLP